MKRKSRNEYRLQNFELSAFFKNPFVDLKSWAQFIFKKLVFFLCVFSILYSFKIGYILRFSASR